MVITLLTLILPSFKYFDTVAWQEGHLACKKFCTSNPQRFSETFMAVGLIWSDLRNNGWVKQIPEVVVVVIVVVVVNAMK